MRNQVRDLQRIYGVGAINDAVNEAFEEEEEENKKEMLSRNINHLVVVKEADLDCGFIKCATGHFACMTCEVFQVKRKYPCDDVEQFLIGNSVTRG